MHSPIIVHFLASYYSHWAHINIAPRSADLNDAFNFCRAVKIGRVPDSIKFPWKNYTESIEMGNDSRPRLIFGEFIKKKIFDCGIRKPLIVPVPSKDGLFDASDFRSYQMIREALRGDSNFPIVPLVRFTETLPRLSESGSRRLSEITDALTITHKIYDRNIVIVDDIITSGNTIKSVDNIIRNSDMQISAVIACGHTVHKPSSPAFGNNQIKIFVDNNTGNNLLEEGSRWIW